MSLSGIDLRVIIHELKRFVEKAWIVNIYEIPGKIFIFKLRKSQESTRLLLIEPGKRIHMTEFNRVMPEAPTRFASTLRSHLRNKMINSIEQQDLDRVVSLNIGPEPGYTLSIELFGQGNLILVSPQNKIISAISYRKMRDRDIHPGRIFYTMPPQERDIIRNGTDDLQVFLGEYSKLVPALNQWLGLGPYYSRYLLKLANIEKKLTEELSDDDISEISELATTLKNRLLEHDYQPIVYLDQEEKTSHEESDETQFEDQWDDSQLQFLPEDVFKILPWAQPVGAQDELSVLEIENLNKAYDIYYSAQEKQEIIIGESAEIETKADKLERLLSDQRNHQQNLIETAKQERMQADTLYQYFTEAEELISTVYNARKNNVSWEEILEKLAIAKEKGMKAGQIFKEAKVEQASLILELQHNETPLLVPVDFRKTLVENANILYESAKKSEKKAKGAEKAIAMTLEKIEKAKTDVSDKLGEAKEQAIILKRRKVWYEKFHWCFAPDTTLVIGGLDASSNERLVKRYLEGDDLFAHADLQGASAVVIKHEGRKISQPTREIAAKLAVCYSSGWKAKLGVANAFIVESEQVSMTPPSGEYLPKGSFMIYGQKEFHNNLPLELFIGVIFERHWARIASGPEECVSECDIVAKIVPGQESKGKVAKDIKNRFANKADDLELQKLDALDVNEIAWFIPGDSKIESITVKS